jgi:hypothetical protein
MGQLNVWPEFGFRNGRGGAPLMTLTTTSLYHTLRSVWANSQVVSEVTYGHSFDIDPETECASQCFHVMS